MKSSIWGLPALDSENQELEHICELGIEEPLQNENVLNLDWHPTKVGSLATVLDEHLLVWDVAGGSPKVFKSRKNYTGVHNHRKKHILKCPVVSNYSEFEHR
jgi:hypothetical protein